MDYAYLALEMIAAASYHIPSLTLRSYFTGRRQNEPLETVPSVSILFENM